MGSCCAQEISLSDDESENKFKYDPQKQPSKGALGHKASKEEKKFVKFPTRVRQDDDEKHQQDQYQEDDLGQQHNEDNNAFDCKSHKSQKSQRTHKTHQSNQSQNNIQDKKTLFEKQKSQFVKCDDE